MGRRMMMNLSCLFGRRLLRSSMPAWGRSSGLTVRRKIWRPATCTRCVTLVFGLLQATPASLTIPRNAPCGHLPKFRKKPVRHLTRLYKWILIFMVMNETVLMWHWNEANGCVFFFLIQNNIDTFQRKLYFIHELISSVFLLCFKVSVWLNHLPCLRLQLCLVSTSPTPNPPTLLWARSPRSRYVPEET